MTPEESAAEIISRTPSCFDEAKMSFRERADEYKALVKAIADAIRAAVVEERATLKAPTWCTPDEMKHWLLRQNYSEQIASELAQIIATNYQLAFEKGFEMGQRARGEKPS